METDLCRRAVVGGVVEGGWDGRLVSQAWVLALDGVRMLVGVAAIVVATGVPGKEFVSSKFNQKSFRLVKTLPNELESGLRL